MNVWEFNPGFIETQTPVPHFHPLFLHTTFGQKDTLPFYLPRIKTLYPYSALIHAVMIKKRQK